MERIILSTKDNLVYTGLELNKKVIDEEQGILIELDSNSGLKLWCPESNIDSVLTIKLNNKKIK